MGWSYDKTLNTDKDYVRFLIGDTDTNNQLVDDETINAVLSNEANKFMAAAAVLEAMANANTLGGAVTDRKVGETRIKYRSATEMRMVAAGLKLRGAAHMKPEAGGIYTSDRDDYDEDTSLDRPEIAKGMFNNPAVDQSLTNTTS